MTPAFHSRRSDLRDSILADRFQACVNANSPADREMLLLRLVTEAIDTVRYPLMQRITSVSGIKTEVPGSRRAFFGLPTQKIRSTGWP